MKYYFFSSLRRFVLTVVALLIGTLYATAGNTYYAYYASVSAYPSGKGQVYISEYGEAPYSDYDYSDYAEVKEVSKDFSRYVYAKPEPGYIFAGISQDYIEYTEYDEVLDYHFSGEITSTGNPAQITFISNVSGEDEEIVKGNMPLDPNGSFSAVFTRVVAEVPLGQERLGSVSIDKVANDIGDEVTLTATPLDDRFQFDRWTLNDETVSTEPEFKVVVTDSAHYVAHFSGESAVTINFPKEGGYVPFYNYDYTAFVPDGVPVVTFKNNNISRIDNEIYAEPFSATYQISRNNPAWLYGKGEVTLVLEDDYIYTDDDLLDRWSGDNGVSVDTLDPRNAYYIADMKAEKLDRVTGVIAPKQIYVSVPDSFFTTAPEVIFFSEEAAQNYAAGIGTVKSVDVKGLGRIYTIEGREVALPEENKLYIIDGKKVIYRKK